MIIKYSENQYVDGKLVLLACQFYEYHFDTINSEAFVVNFNNNIIYLNKISTMYEVYNNIKKGREYKL